MAKEKTCYVCASCGYETARWLGCCPDCGEWNTFEERKTVSPISVASKTAEKAARYQTTQKTEPIPLSKVQERSMPRSSTGNEELDRVLGGGLVPGSAILIGGDPGIGKSTLLLQVAGSLSRQCRVLYVSGEESAHQIKMRASRIGVPQDTLYVLTENDVESVLEKCGRLQPDVLVIDSIQTMVSQDSASAPGSVSQVRQSAGAIVRFAKETGTSVFIVGHVTKEGSLAGPRVLEHMVDAVLYFEGDRQHEYRLLRAVMELHRPLDESILAHGAHNLRKQRRSGFHLILKGLIVALAQVVRAQLDLPQFLRSGPEQQPLKDALLFRHHKPPPVCRHCNRGETGFQEAGCRRMASRVQTVSRKRASCSTTNNVGA